MSSDNGDDEQDPKSDLINRYERLSQFQIDSLKNFDRKVWRSIRISGIVLGAALTGLSILVSNQSVETPQPNPLASVAVAVGSVAIIASIGFGIVSYLSARVSTTPSSELGENMRNKTDQDLDEYQNKLIEGYVETINDNYTVLSAKSRRFRYTLASLLVGVIFLSASVLLLLFPVPLPFGLLIIYLLFIVSLAIINYIVEQQYAVLDG